MIQGVVCLFYCLYAYTYIYIYVCLIYYLPLNYKVMRATIYTVWINKGGDMFKGYENTFVSSHLNEEVANKVAANCHGFVDSEEENCHPDYISSLQAKDKELLQTIQ